MKIGIDARLINETGVGRYIRNLLVHLSRIDKTNTYCLFLRSDAYESFRVPGSNFTKVLADVPWHSVKEQIVMPQILTAARLDLLHVPYFNLPIFYSGKMIATIHDLTILHFDTGRATTRSWVFYKLRRIGYRLILWWGLRKAVGIIAVSQSTKEELIDHFHTPAEKILVTYEGVDEAIIRGKHTNKSDRPLIEKPYFLYVGNAYPHKNLEALIGAFRKFLRSLVATTTSPKLVLVGGHDFFYNRLHQEVSELGLDQSVIFFGRASDKQLINLYCNSLALVFPSLMEGFGLPALEAVSLGARVLLSDIPVFHEIVGNRATYFDPESEDDLAQKLHEIRKQPQVVSTLGFDTGLFNWDRLAQDTLHLYERCTRL